MTSTASRARPTSRACAGRGFGLLLYGAPLAGLHGALGFRKVAHFSEVGKKFGRWVDVGYWEPRLGRQT